MEYTYRNGDNAIYEDNGNTVEINKQECINKDEIFKSLNEINSAILYSENIYPKNIKDGKPTAYSHGIQYDYNGFTYKIEKITKL